MDRVRVAAFLAAVTAFSGCATSGHRQARPVPTSALASPRGLTVMQHASKAPGPQLLTVGGGGLRGGQAARPTPTALTNRAPSGAEQFFPMLAAGQPEPATSAPAADPAPAPAPRVASSRPSAFAERDRGERFAVARARNSSHNLAARHIPDPDEGVLPIAISAELPPRDDHSRLASVDLHEDGTPVEPAPHVKRPSVRREGERSPIPAITATLAKAPATPEPRGVDVYSQSLQRTTAMRMQSPEQARGPGRPFLALRQWTRKIGEKFSSLLKGPKFFNKASRSQLTPGSLTPIHPPE